MGSVNYTSYKDEVMKAIKEAEQLALLAAGILAKGDAMLLAPVAEKAGGSLRQTIDYDVDIGKVYIGSTSGYAVYVEKGTGIYAEDHDGRKTPWVYYDNKMEQYYYTDGQEPQPFIRPSVEKNQKEITKIFERELMKLGNG